MIDFFFTPETIQTLKTVYLIGWILSLPFMLRIGNRRYKKDFNELPPKFLTFPSFFCFPCSGLSWYHKRLQIT